MKLRKLTIKNLLPFEKASIDFSKYGMLLIVGDNQTQQGADSNGSGKSSVLDIITWAFYGKFLRKVPKDDIIRFRATNGHAVLSFEIDGEVYRIRRYRGSNNRVELHRKDEGGTVDLTAKTPTLTQETIDRLTGMDIDTFRAVAYFGQRDVSDFAEGTSKDRLAIVGKILGLHIVERAAKLARDRASAEETERDRLVAKQERAVEALDELMGPATEDDWTAQLIRLQKLVPKEEEALEVARATLVIAKGADELRTEAEYWESELGARKAHRGEDLDRWKRQLAKGAEKAAKLESLQMALDDAMAKFEKQALLDYAQYVPGDLPVDEQIAEAQEKGIGLQNKVAKALANRGTCDRGRKELLEVLDQKGSKCPTCQRVIDDKAAVAIRKAAGVLDEQAQGYSEKLKTLRKKQIAQAKVVLELQEQKQRIETLKEQVDDLERQRNEAEAAARQSAEIEKTIAERRAHHKERIAEAKAKRIAANEACKNLPSDEPDMSALEQEIEMAKLVLAETRANIAHIESAKKQKRSLDEELAGYGVDLDELGQHIRQVRYWAEGFPRIRLLVVDSFIPELEGEVNRYLERLYPSVRVRFETVVPLQKGGSAEKFEIFITDLETGREGPWDGWSGGEKKRLALALYLGMNAVAGRAMESRIEFLMLDEVLADLDETGRQAALELFDAEREQDRSIILISHLPGIQQNFPDVLTVVKRDGIASIRE